MKFLYKIYSRYDGFTPSAIPNRAVNDGKRLVLGWQKYIDSVSRNDECWIYYHGPHRFQNGVYVKGSIHAIDHDALDRIEVRVSGDDIVLVSDITLERAKVDIITPEIVAVRW